MSAPVLPTPFMHAGLPCDIRCCGHVWRYRVHGPQGVLTGLRPTRKLAVASAKMRATRCPRPTTIDAAPCARREA